MAQHGYLREYDQGWDRGGDRDRGLMFGGGDRLSSGSDWDRSSRDFRSRQDDHYLSWRDKQMEALDRDYADYCREREQQFHHDFDSWRRSRQSNPPPLQTGMTQSGSSQESTDTLELTTEAATADPMAAPIAGTTSDKNRRGR